MNEIHIVDLENGMLHIVNLTTEACESIPLIVLSDLTEYAEEIEDIGAAAITQVEGPAKVSPLADVLTKAIRGRIGPQESEPEQTSEHEQEPEREPGSDDQD